MMEDSLRVSAAQLRPSTTMSMQTGQAMDDGSEGGLEIVQMVCEVDTSPQLREEMELLTGVSNDLVREIFDGVHTSLAHTLSGPLLSAFADTMTSTLEHEKISSCQIDLPATELTFLERLNRAVPVTCLASRVDWSRLVAAEATELLGQSETAEVAAIGSRARRRTPGVAVDVNSGGQVFFALLEPPGGPGSGPEEAIVLKFCKHSRFVLQSEQMAAELAEHLDLAVPASRLLVKWEPADGEEWQALLVAAQPVCDVLSAALQARRTLLVMQFIAGLDMQNETQAWTEGCLGSSVHQLGRLFVLDALLGNADRLSVKSLGWRGNSSNVIWRNDSIPGSSGGSCAPIDAVVSRRPPKQMVQEIDQKVRCLLELTLLDAPSAYDVLLEIVACNPAATKAVESDWATRQARRAAAAEAAASKTASEEPMGKAGADDILGQPFEAPVASHGMMSPSSADGSCFESPMLAVEAFQRGVRAALDKALRERGLLETMVDIIRSWLDAFHEDMMTVVIAPGANWKTETIRLQRLKQHADKNEEVNERLASWQSLLQERSVNLRQAVDEWAARRGVASSWTFRGFLGQSVLNPVVDAYELLVRLQQLLSRLKVMSDAGITTRPRDLYPSPLFLGSATSATSLHLLRKLGVTCLVNCSVDLPEPSAEDLGNDIGWHRCPIEDVEDQEVLPQFDESLRVIDEAVKAGGRALAYCHLGRSRSVSLCLAYLVTRERRTLSEAVKFIRSRRPESSPNTGFWRQLLTLELATLGSNSMTAADLPKGKPKGLKCDICQQIVGLTEAALETHMKLKHQDSAMMRP
eukprot:TRINITY_DN50834_c0_g1_i1.p1 TRINITY_DN50834_c0_g1~~TRINITY_DN50834_c0_g1_i1.p1  ORF type:complete len:808 (+),score=128.77 TRINITY_DN50834_c0_g1_i1:63-2486(+)